MPVRETKLLAFHRVTIRSFCRAIGTIALINGVFSTSLLGGVADASGKRRFTVKDSIELSHIVDPARVTTLATSGEQDLGFPIYSPDGKHFLLVTQRGDLATNTLNGTIWLFERRSAGAFRSDKFTREQLPRRVITLSSRSNTPIIYDVRWIEGSKKISFLGKDANSCQRLFVVDVGTSSLAAMTQEGLYVTAYDIQNETIAYTVLEPDQDIVRQSSLISVGQSRVYDLLYWAPPAREDIPQIFLRRHANSLHIIQNGKEVPARFTMLDRPLQLFIPTLALSPDGRSLITVALVHDVPIEWERYQPSYEQYRLKVGPFLEDSLRNDSVPIPEQYVTVDLKTGVASPLIAAPAGRDLGSGGIPTEAFWLDNQNAVITNTFIPFAGLDEEATRIQKSKYPAVAVVNTSSKHVQTGIELRDPPSSQERYHIKNLKWDETNRELSVQFASEGVSDKAAPAPERYSLRSGKWFRLPRADSNTSYQPEADLQLSVREDLNNPPRLWVEIRGEPEFVLWDPNLQLKDVDLGKASIYHWQDAKGIPWSGVLVLPPDYDVKRRYPLVIQTHGYDADKFFTDGYVTTANGGRALAAKGIIVLQSDMDWVHLTIPEEGSENLGGLESAIDRLVSGGLVDPTRIGIIGFSRTCFHVLYALTNRPDLFRAASITDGVNFGYVEYTLASGPNGYTGDAEAIMGGAASRENLIKWIQNSPNFNLDKVKSPLLISALERGELLSEWETYSRLRMLNKPVELLWWWRENTAHVLIQPAQRYASQQSAVDWFDFWLNGAEDPDPAKAEQYLRWRELRRLQ